MITEKNGSNILTKDISCECKCEFDGRKSNSDQWCSNDKYGCECKKHNICEKDYIWNLATWSCENEKYLASVIDDSFITCHETIEETKTIPTNFSENEKYLASVNDDSFITCHETIEETKTIPTSFSEKYITSKKKSFYILLAFLLISNVLLIAASIDCHLIKYQVKQKHLS